MTKDEIAQMMQDSSGMHWGTEAHFQRFAALVAAAEREACVKVCITAAQKLEREGSPAPMARICAAAIRARSNP